MKKPTYAIIALTLPLMAKAGFAGTMETLPQNNTTFYVQGGLGASLFQELEGNQVDTDPSLAFDVKAGLLFKSQTNTRLGMELGYFNLGKQDFAAVVYDDYSMSGYYNMTGDFKQSGVDLLAVANIGLNDKVSAVLKLGGAYVNQSIDVRINNYSATLPEEKKLLPEAALGLHYNINEKIALTGEWRYIDGSDNDEGIPIVKTNTFTLGLKVNLG